MMANGAVAVWEAPMRDSKSRVFLSELAATLEAADRFGAVKDKPEGARWIQVSDTLARTIVKRLREIAEYGAVTSDPPDGEAG